MMSNSAQFPLVFLIASLVIPFAFANAESASKQFQNGTPINEIQCDNPDHILVERNNGNPACVTERTAEKLGWEQIILVESVAQNYPLIAEEITKLDIEQSQDTGTASEQPHVNDTKSSGLSTLEMIEKLAYRPPKDPSLSIPSVAFPPGDQVSIAGYAFGPHHSLMISIINPSGETVKQKLLTSAEDHFFESKFFTVPPGAQHGIWKVQIQDGTNHLESTFEVGNRYIPQPPIKTVDETFDTLQCENTDDPLIIHKCWEQEKILKNINCSGWHNSIKNDCRPPDSAYREPPSFYQDSYADIIPQDITFDYALKAPPDDVDAFAQKLANFMNDTIVEKKPTGRVSYETEKGDISFRSNMMTDGFAIEYSISGAGRINPDIGTQFTADLLDELGITLDGTEFYREGAFTSYYTHQFWQQKDGIKIVSNSIATMIEPGWTLIHINNWNDNLSEMDLYDVNESIKNGQDFALNNEQLNDISCQLEMREGLTGEVTLVILEGRPLYETYGGSCQVHYMDGHTGWYSVFVDALTGEPLFIENRNTF